MRFAPLVLDVASDALTARVDDELYTNATAPFGDLAKAERGWVRMLVERIVTTWTGAPVATARYEIATGPTTLSVDGAPAPSFDALDAAARASIARDLENLMDVAQGILRIDGGVPAAAKQKRGELSD